MRDSLTQFYLVHSFFEINACRNLSLLSLQQLGQLFDNLVTDILGARIAAHVLCAQTTINSNLNSLLDQLGLLRQVQ